MRTRRTARRHAHPAACGALAVAWLTAFVPDMAGAGPLAVTDRSPVARIFALPAPASARLPAALDDGLDASLDWSSIAIVSGDLRDGLVLDGESVALTLRWRQRHGAWRLGGDLPFVQQGGGVLDGFIDGYHELFGFPDGDRPRLPTDALLYRVVRDTQPLLEVRSQGGGVGDVSLHAARQLVTTPAFALAARVQLVLPTGDSARLLGSGGAGLALALDVQRVALWRDRSLEWFAGLGVRAGERGEVLRELRRPVVPYGHAGLSWAWRPSVTLTAQLDAHGAFYDSGLRGLGEAFMLSVGGRLWLREGWHVDLAVGEDIAPRTVPDVVFHLALGRSGVRR